MNTVMPAKPLAVALHGGHIHPIVAVIKSLVSSLAAICCRQPSGKLISFPQRPNTHCFYCF